MRTFLLALSLMIAGASVAQAAKPRVIVGYIEKVHIEDVETTFKAKLDTGATTSSIHSEILKIVVPKGGPTKENMGRVIFSVIGDDGKALTLERRIRRWVRIKTKDGGYIRRPVIHMTFCVAGQLIRDEVNLSDRDNFIYPVLIGRNMMSEGTLIVDPSITYTSKPNCPARVTE